jgi:hypothetical protein
MARRTPRPALTAEQQVEADRIRGALLEASAADIRELAELLASKDDTDTFGATEFAVRDIVHRIGAKAIRSALSGRKKGGTTGPAAPAPTATRPPSSNGTGPSPS